MTTHALRLYTSAADLQLVCGKATDDASHDYVVGPQETDKIDCLACLRVLARDGHQLAKLRSCDAASLVQTSRDELASLEREAENTGESAEYRMGCRRSAAAHRALLELLGEAHG